MLLSVLSALARRGVDPWDQAAKLARLPVETATQLLASLIAPLPDDPPADVDTLTISARLIALLPGRAGSNIDTRPHNGFIGMGRMTRFKIAVLCVIFVALALGFQFITVGHAPQTQAGTAKEGKVN